ncbi:MAG: DNA polymerase IV [Cryomorphaceae bacterium BACL7 MAG-120910-bin2]|jgi:DNA polymerase IV|nr:MAG: DNA polymerase IV [Cryomorphaceae bacterium BACL7 MAG-120910-bin2]KRO68936.1 MAG: DNA polymerase IV [Cryomorphaceae bacterium BACL7 MAG-120322-bin74]KRO83125.1 MAG: DNA polymerase IV [Cryomorphaceae bacterium BACL7 MAG-121220-bin83]NQW25760.1 DNA polymerase IV [Cryomorphaceae bacterium]
MQRHVLHMDLDSFFVSVERLHDSRLEGRPILIGGTSDRGVVASCSYEARQYGIRSAMPMRMARSLCPEAIVIRGNSAAYSKQSNLVTDIIQTQVPILEKASIDEFYADLTGMDRFFGALTFASTLRQRVIQESGLPISFGLSINKTVSKVATGEAKPNNQRHVNQGDERAFLSPLSVRKIPMVGEKTYQTLRNLGIQHIRTLQEMPVDMLYSVFGKHGKTIWEKAQGVDESPVQPTQERKSISTERTFDQDTADIEKLRSILMAMVENLAFQLRRGNKLTSCIRIKIRYADFQTHSQQVSIPYTASDAILLAKAKELFERLYDRRVRIRLIGINLSGLVGGGEQYHLFETCDRNDRLYAAMDQIRNTYGDRSIVRAYGLGARTIGRGNPFNGEPPPLLPNRRQ